MSRIGVRPVPVLPGVEISVSGGELVVKGPRATLVERMAPDTIIEVRDGQAVVLRQAEHKRARSAHGLMRSLLANMVQGVTAGFERGLEVVGVGYRMEVNGRELTLNVGYSHPVRMPIPEGLDVRAESNTRIVVSGASKQQLGQFAANIRKVRPPEPYKGKGIRYVGEEIRRKVGKSAGS